MSHFFHIRMRHFLHIEWIFILVNHKLFVQVVVVSTYILRIVKKIHSKIIFWTFEPSLLTFFPLDQSEKWQTIKYCLAILQYYLYRLPNFSLDFQCTIKISRNSGGLEIISGYFVLCYRCDDYNAIEMFIKIRYTPSSYISIYTLQVQITRNKIKEIYVHTTFYLGN